MQTCYRDKPELSPLIDRFDELSKSVDVLSARITAISLRMCDIETQQKKHHRRLQQVVIFFLTAIITMSWSLSQAIVAHRDMLVEHDMRIEYVDEHCSYQLDRVELKVADCDYRYDRLSKYVLLRGEK